MSINIRLYNEVAYDSKSLWHTLAAATAALSSGKIISPCPSVEIAVQGVVEWLKVLKICDVDLEEYGRKEKCLYASNIVSNILKHDYTFNTETWLYNDPLSSSYFFSYGPNVSDWQFWFIEQADNSVIEFWDMVENPEKAMPGAWIEDIEDLKNYGIR
ncbi:hypothetical protein IFR05_012406 [Cadophora sp. M221]|nr:hypothetical protein IFR05_012406 [Cadophora sp. M221]